MGYNSKTQTFDTIIELRASAGRDNSTAQCLGYYVPGDFGAAVSFYYDDDSTAEDNSGTIIKPDAVDDSDPGRWLMLIPSNTLNVRWFGAKAADNSLFDSYPALQAALDIVEANTSITSIYIPADTSGNGYYFMSETVETDFEVHIYGDGNIEHIKSRLKWGGIVCWDFQSTEFDYNFSVKHLNFEQFTPGGARDTSIHAIIYSQRGEFVDVSVTYAQGNGFHGDACAVPDVYNFGNIDLSTFTRCSANNCYNGWFLNGCDSNALSFYDCSAVNNVRHGLWDNSFLGVRCYSWHFAANGISGLSTVTYGGNTYTAVWNGNINTGVDTPNINKQPDINPSWWALVTNDTIAGASPWNNALTYISGGPYNVTNPNAYSGYYDTYSESFQPPAFLNGRSIAIGGDNGAGVFGGTWIRQVLGSLVFANPSDVIIPRFSNDGVDFTFKNTAEGMRLTRNGVANDISFNYYGVGRVGTPGSGIGITYETETYLPAGSPFIIPPTKLGWTNATAPDIQSSLTPINYKPGTQPSGAFNGTNQNTGTTFLVSGVYIPNYENYNTWKPSKNGAIGTTLLATDMIGNSGFLERQFTSENDTPIGFFPAQIAFTYTECALQFNLTILASNAAGDIWSVSRLILIRVTGGVATEVSNNLIGTETKEGTMSGCDFDLTIDASLALYNLSFTGLAADAVNWSVSFKKNIINYPTS